MLAMTLTAVPMKAAQKRTRKVNSEWKRLFRHVPYLGRDESSLRPIIIDFLYSYLEVAEIVPDDSDIHQA